MNKSETTVVKLTGGIPTIRYINCPQCGKSRLTKYELEDGTVQPVSEETERGIDGQTYLVDVCNPCSRNRARKEKTYIVRQSKLIRRAISNIGNKQSEGDVEDIEL